MGIDRRNIHYIVKSVAPGYVTIMLFFIMRLMTKMNS